MLARSNLEPAADKIWKWNTQVRYNSKKQFSLNKTVTVTFVFHFCSLAFCSSKPRPSDRLRCCLGRSSEDLEPSK